MCNGLRADVVESPSLSLLKRRLGVLLGPVMFHFN